MSDRSEDAATMALARALENLARAVAELASRMPQSGQFTVVHRDAGARDPGGYGAANG